MPTSQPGFDNDPIEHIVMLVMENHSFDQMLGCLDAVHEGLDGISAAQAKGNDDGQGHTFHPKPTTEKQILLDPPHDHPSVLRQIANGNSGFVREFTDVYPRSDMAARQSIMGYYPLDSLSALHSLGRNFTVCDRWFASVPGPTWPNRFFALTGTSHGKTEMPNGRNSIEPHWYTEQDQDTIFDRLNAAGRSWKVYYYDFPLSLLLTHQRCPENLSRYEFVEHFFADAAGAESEFPEFSLIEPRYFGEAQNDDHPPHNIAKAQKLIADTYNALRSNRALWAKTLLVVFYDEHGGFYDHVSPPTDVAAPDEHTRDFEFTTLGVRVPALLVSPWCDAGVNHTQFDHTSLLRYLCDKWGMEPLGERTRTANSIAAAIRTTGEPRLAGTPPFIRVPNELLIPDDTREERYATNKNAQGLHAFADYLREHEDALAADAVGASAVEASAKVTRATPWVVFKYGLGQLAVTIGERLSQDYQQGKLARERQTADTVTQIQASHLRG